MQGQKNIKFPFAEVQQNQNSNTTLHQVMEFMYLGEARIHSFF
jgi:hypothetical protein